MKRALLLLVAWSWVSCAQVKHLEATANSPVTDGTRDSVTVPDMNRAIQKLWATIDKESSVCLGFDVDMRRLDSVNGPEIWARLLVRAYDENGQFLTQFVTKETFTQERNAASLTRDGFGRSYIGLKPEGNQGCYQLNKRDARDVEKVEVGFTDVYGR